MTEILKQQQRPYRVLHVVGSMVKGGAESWLMNLLRKANRTVLEMEFCALLGEKGTYCAEIESLGSRVILCPVKPILTFPIRMRRVLRQGNYDVVHSHTWLFSGLVLKVSHECNVSIRIAYAHTTRSKPPSLYRTLYSWYMRRLINEHATHRLGCASEAMTALFGGNWRNFDNCKVLYTSIDIDSYRTGQPPIISKSDFGIPSDAIVVGHVGSFRMAKNHTFFLDIAAELVKIEPRVYFFFAGDGELRQAMEAKASRLGLSNRVVFAGVRDDVPQLLMHLFDVLLFPSVYEGMPLTLVEAAAAGLRTICSDVITREATDVLPEAFTRLSLDMGSKQWAVKVLEALAKPKVPCEHAYNQVKASHFSVCHCLRELEEIYACG